METGAVEDGDHPVSVVFFVPNNKAYIVQNTTFVIRERQVLTYTGFHPKNA
jgi:hypothetical protein